MCAAQRTIAGKMAPARWHIGCIIQVTGDFVCKCGLTKANGNAVGNSAHLTPPAVSAECRQRFFPPGAFAMYRLAAMLKWSF